MPDNVSCPGCYGNSFTYERTDLEVIPGKNLFDISVINVQESSARIPWISAVGDDYFVISQPDGYTGNGGMSFGNSLLDIVPGLQAGQSYVLSMDTESSCRWIYLSGSNRLWRTASSLILDDVDLASPVAFMA